MQFNLGGFGRPILTGRRYPTVALILRALDTGTACPSATTLQSADAKCSGAGDRMDMTTIQHWTGQDRTGQVGSDGEVLK